MNMKNIFADLTPKQIKVLPLLAAGMPAASAAKKAGVSAQTISEWNHDSRFKSALNRMRQDALESVQMELEATGKEAVQTLKELLRESKSDQVRLRAAIFVVERLSDSRALDNLIVSQTADLNLNGLIDLLGGKQ